MELFELTHIGQVRKNNEDQVYTYIHPKGYTLGLVCDGLGGHRSGELASSLTKACFEQAFNEIDIFNEEKAVIAWLKKTIKQAHQLVKKQSLTTSKHLGMATTIVAALTYNDQVYIANVGDSRAYLYYQHQLKQLTEDQTLVNVLYKNGAISKKEIENHPQRNVLLSAVGGEGLEIDLISVEIKDKMTILLCSDGLYHMVKASKIADIIENTPILSQCGRRLVDEANRHGGLDNISVVLMKFEGGEVNG